MSKWKDAIARDLWVVLLDIISVNLSYYLALIIRFFVGGELRAVAVNRYMPAWISFTPWYTVLAIIVFFALRLYGGLWRYAGVNDMNRIIVANMITTVVHIVGTAAFFTRMPWTYYLIGGLLQFVMVVAIRFSYRVLLVEKKKLKRVDKVPALVVGSGDLGRKVIKHLEENTPYKAVAILSSSSAGRTLDGIPVMSMGALQETIDKVRAVFIADKELSVEDREQIRNLAGDREVNDFTGALSNMNGLIPVASLLSVIEGPVTIKVNEAKKEFGTGREALESLKERYDVIGIQGATLILKKSENGKLDAWMKDYKAVTGEDVSFF